MCHWRCIQCGARLSWVEVVKVGRRAAEVAHVGGGVVVAAVPKVAVIGDRVVFFSDVAS